MKSTLCDRKLEERVFLCQSHVAGVEMLQANTAVIMSITERNHVPIKSVEKLKMSRFEWNYHVCLFTGLGGLGGEVSACDMISGSANHSHSSSTESTKERHARIHAHACVGLPRWARRLQQARDAAAEISDRVLAVYEGGGSQNGKRK